MLLSSAHTQSFGIKSNAPKKPKLIPSISATDLSDPHSYADDFREELLGFSDGDPRHSLRSWVCGTTERQDRSLGVLRI